MTVPLMEMVLASGARRFLLFLFVVVLLGVLLKRLRGRTVVGAVLALLVIAAAWSLVARSAQPHRWTTRLVNFTNAQTRQVTETVVETVTDSVDGLAEHVTVSAHEITAPARRAPWLGQCWSLPRSGLWMAICAATLAAMIFLAYLFLDSGTRGQFTWPLRIFAVVAFVGLCVMLVVLRPGF